MSLLKFVLSTAALVIIGLSTTAVDDSPIIREEHREDKGPA
jgi:hypothetical protein